MGNKSNDINEKYIEGNIRSMPIDHLLKVVAQLKCTCEIINGNCSGTGFFCNIPFPDDRNLFPVLITCRHVFNPENNSTMFTKTIDFSVGEKDDKKEYNLPLDNSRISYTHEDYDITIIEIKKCDGLDMKNFLSVDHIIDDPKIKQHNKNLNVYILDHKEKRELSFSPGVIKDINKIKLYYNCDTAPGSSGGPIINIKSFGVIGIHKGYSPTKKLNKGILIKEPIIDFYKTNINEIKRRNQNNLNNNLINSNIMQYRYAENNNNGIKIDEQKKNNYSGNKEIKEAYIQNINDNIYDYSENKKIKKNSIPNFYENAKFQEIKKNFMQNIDEDKRFTEIKEDKKINENELEGFIELKDDNIQIAKKQGSDSFTKVTSFLGAFYPELMEINENNIQENYMPSRMARSTVLAAPREDKSSYPLIHEHSFSCNDAVNKECMICGQKINGIPCHECNCKIVLCLDCGFKILHGKKNNYLHNHTLKLTYKNNYWSCNICNFEYWPLKKVSFYCQQCNYNVCDICFFKEKKDNATPLKLNDNLKNKNEQTKSLITEDYVEKKNEEVKSSDLYNSSIHNHSLHYNKELCTQCRLCNKFIINKPGYECYHCEIILCLYCGDKVYKRKNNNYFHKHNLMLKNNLRVNRKWNCKICNGKFSNISFHCEKCKYDVCYKCYLNNSK
jgi:hypothetical protein